MEAVEEVLAEAALGDELIEVGVGGRHHPHVDVNRAGLADRQNLPGLEKPEQLRLQVQRHLADLVEEERAAFGGADQSRVSWVAPVNDPRR